MLLPDQHQNIRPRAAGQTIAGTERRCRPVHGVVVGSFRNPDTRHPLHANVVILVDHGGLADEVLCNAHRQRSDPLVLLGMFKRDLGIRPRWLSAWRHSSAFA